jgi:hypothetical protein
MAKELLYKVAYNEAVRALSEQQAAIESVRARAGLLLSIAALTTSVLGAPALQGGGPGIFSWLALLSFAVIAGASIAIFWPHDWEFVASPRSVVEAYAGSAEAVPAEHLYRDLSLRMHGSVISNHQGLQSLAALFQVASALLTLEVVLWVAAIATNL